MVSVESERAEENFFNIERAAFFHSRCTIWKFSFKGEKYCGRVEIYCDVSGLERIVFAFRDNKLNHLKCFICFAPGNSIKESCCAPSTLEAIQSSTSILSN